jgi:hypothetical protein
MIAAIVYVLCTVTSACCAVLLLRQYRGHRSRLLFWSGLSFAIFACANALVFTDLVVLPDVDLSLVRAIAGFVAIAVLLYGLVWEAD